MKRSKSLVGLSREHHAALVLAIRAQRIDTDNTQVAHQFMAHVVEAFELELQPHFIIEETVLLPFMESAGEIDQLRRSFRVVERVFEHGGECRVGFQVFGFQPGQRFADDAIGLAGRGDVGECLRFFR